MLTEADMLEMVKQEADLDVLCRTLMETAYRKGSADNISLVLVRNEGGVEL